MRELLTEIPDANFLLELEPEELGAKLLFLLRARAEAMFHPGNLTNELWQWHGVSGLPEYPKLKQREIELVVSEAFAWLEAQGLSIPSPGINGTHGWRVLSRRARRFENEAEFARYEVARRLPIDSLHPRIQKRVWLAFMRGEFDVAVFQAMKAVEVAVRAATNISKSGVQLMREAFNPESGPLRDSSVEAGERVARMELFAGTYGAYRNPHAHRDVPLDDPTEAIEVILLANHLLRIVESRCRTISD